eukprot:scaffold28035_cov211-Skeletonema_marinoi.AAC.8
MNSAPPSGGATNSSSTYGMTMTPEQASKKFDVLRREATKLERHLEDCVAKISAVSTVMIHCGAVTNYFWHGIGIVAWTQTLCGVKMKLKSLSGMQNENSSQHSTTYVLSLGK